MDLSIGEFEEVGNTVKEFSSDDATVVVGTVIDPELENELRVTVVATGLGAGQPAAATPAEEAPRTVARKSSGEVDYQQLDRPTVIRKKAANDRPSGQDEGDMDYLDIPAFLRRQAD